MTQPFDLAVRHARVHRCNGSGTPEERLAVLDSGAVGFRDGRIAYVGPDMDLDAREVLDAHGDAVLPGFVDCHTHLVFAGSRVNEFARRMKGEDYRTIADEGGGIAATVRATRDADDDALFASTAARARGMRRRGTTVAEVKSGYGLEPSHELRLLSVARRVEAEGLLRVTTSYLGAHAILPEWRERREAYVDEVIETLQAVSERGLADACDVYLDDGAFTLDEAHRVLVRAKHHGLAVRGHVGQFADLGGAELLADLDALSADHLEQVSDDGLARMAGAGVVAVLLPGAWRTLRQTPPTASRLRNAGVSIAVGTDCNPGTSPTTDLPSCAALAVRDAGLTPEEAVIAITADAARAAGLGHEVGRLEEGYRGDCVLLPGTDGRVVGYALGGLEPWAVVQEGHVVHQVPRDAVAPW